MDDHQALAAGAGEGADGGSADAGGWGGETLGWVGSGRPPTVKQLNDSGLGRWGGVVEIWVEGITADSRYLCFSDTSI